jgi:hypothetical protein
VICEVQYAICEVQYAIARTKKEKVEEEEEGRRLTSRNDTIEDTTTGD